MKAIARHLCDMPEPVQITLDPDLAPDGLSIKVGVDLWRAVLAERFDHGKPEAQR